MDTNEKLIWYRNEVPLFEELLKYKQGLIDDFMQGYNTLEEAVLAQSENTVSHENYTDDVMEMAEGMLVSRDPNTLRWSTDFEAWKSVGIRNLVRTQGVVMADDTIPEEESKRYPTAMSLLNKYHKDFFGLVYSAIGPMSILQRHVGPENIDGEYVRIHLPLIVPEGDMFLEVHGQEVTWDDIFAFNNQYLHSAHNYSNEWRLIMIIDLSRELCGIPPGKYFSEGNEREKPFIRGWKF